MDAMHMRDMTGGFNPYSCSRWTDGRGGNLEKRPGVQRRPAIRVGQGSRWHRDADDQEGGT